MYNMYQLDYQNEYSYFYGNLISMERGRVAYLYSSFALDWFVTIVCVYVRYVSVHCDFLVLIF